jgi:hypothetical protein
MWRFVQARRDLFRPLIAVAGHSPVSPVGPRRCSENGARQSDVRATSSGDRQDGTNQGLDVAGGSVDGLRSTFRRTQHFLPPFDTGWIEGGNISGFLRTVRDWLV